MNYRELHRLYELDGPSATVEHVGAALQSGELKPADFSLRELAEAVVPDGREWVRSLDPRGGYEVTEADGVDLTAFANISGQIVYTRLLAAYNSPAFALSRLVETIPTKFDGEKIAGMQPLDPDAVGVVAPGMPFPHAGFGERYIETPSTTKRGFIVPVTKEAIFFDRTHMVLKNAAEVGEALGAPAPQEGNASYRIFHPPRLRIRNEQPSRRLSLSLRLIGLISGDQCANADDDNRYTPVRRQVGGCTVATGLIHPRRSEHGRAPQNRPG